MRVLITGEILRHLATGVEHYTRQLIGALAARGDLDLTVLCRRAEHADGLPAGVAVATYCPPKQLRYPYYGLRPWPHLGEFDVIHCPTVIAPFLRRPKGPKLVMTIHDLIPLAAPHYHHLGFRVYFRHVLPRLMRIFDAFIADSESTRQDMHRLLGTPCDMVTVVPLAARRMGPQVEVPREEEDFLLAVGTVEPRKNLVRVLEAFVRMRQGANVPPTRLLVAGRVGWERTDLVRLIRSAAPDVEMLGYVSDDRLHNLVRRAKALVYPSLYEGFGLPVLEAMAAGCPVITSNRSSLPEVGGDAVIYVDPEKVASIAEAMRQIVDDAELRTALASKGLKRAAEFSWRRCADQTVEVYQCALEGRRRVEESRTVI